MSEVEIKNVKPLLQQTVCYMLFFLCCGASLNFKNGTE